MQCNERNDRGIYKGGNKPRSKQAANDSYKRSIYSQAASKMSPGLKARPK